MSVDALAWLHRKFVRNPLLALTYRDFITKYEKLRRMEPVPNAEITNPGAWYLPHHGVTQAANPNSSLRVVFDASWRTPGGQRLNDFLMVGPRLQQDLSLVLLNWRRYRIVFIGDLIKMFRQIKVVQNYQNLQRIVWAKHPGQTPVDYRPLRMVWPVLLTWLYAHFCS